MRSHRGAPARSRRHNASSLFCSPIIMPRSPSAEGARIDAVPLYGPLVVETAARSDQAVVRDARLEDGQ